MNRFGLRIDTLDIFYTSTMVKYNFFIYYIHWSSQLHMRKSQKNYTQVSLLSKTFKNRKNFLPYKQIDKYCVILTIGDVNTAPYSVRILLLLNWYHKQKIFTKFI